MPFTAVEVELRRRARERAGEGVLVDGKPATAQEKPIGNVCSYCELAIDPSEAIYDYQIHGASFGFHRACHATWLTECEQTGAFDELLAAAEAQAPLTRS